MPDVPSEFSFTFNFDFSEPKKEKTSTSNNLAPFSASKGGLGTNAFDALYLPEFTSYSSNEFDLENRDITILEDNPLPNVTPNSQNNVKQTLKTLESDSKEHPNKNVQSNNTLVFEENMELIFTKNETQILTSKQSSNLYTESRSIFSTNKIENISEIREKLIFKENILALFFEEFFPETGREKIEFQIVPKRLEDLNENEALKLQEGAKKGTAGLGILEQGKLKAYGKEGGKFNELLKKGEKLNFKVPEELKDTINEETLKEIEVYELSESAADELAQALPEIINERIERLNQKSKVDDIDKEKSQPLPTFTEDRVYNGKILRYSLNTDISPAEFLLSIILSDILSDLSSETIKKSQEKIDEQSKEAEAARDFMRQNKRAFDQQTEKLKSELSAAKNSKDQTQQSNIEVRLQLQHIEKSILQDKRKLNILFKALANQVENWAKEIIDSVDSESI